MAKGDELVKFITERVVTYIETPKEVRQQTKLNNKVQKEHWQIRWFGMVPLALRMLVKRRNNKRTPPEA
jgi:hypothetical protein